MPSWLDRLRGGDDAPPAHPGTDGERTAADAVFEVERRTGSGVEDAGAPRDRLAAAVGRALAGRRAAAAVAPDQLPALQAPLAHAAASLVPVLVHAIRQPGDAWGAGPAAAAASGAFVAAARDAAHATDLALLARALTERSLVPGVLLLDDGAPEPVVEPAEALLDELPGHPADVIECPTPAQRGLFGTSRRRLVRWFTPDHPIAHGGARGADAASGVLGRELLFADAVAELAAGCAAELAALSGRAVPPLASSGLRGADTAVVAWGRAGAVAEAVAERLRREGGPKVGVISLTFLRPFPAVQLAALLGRRKAVAVIEPPGDPLAPLPPLALQVGAAAPELAGSLLAATCAGDPDPDALAALLVTLAGGRPPRRLSLDVPRAPAESGFPRRDAVVGALRTALPRLDAELLPAASTPRDVPDAPRVPPVLARIASDRPAPDSLPRFWGEVVQPTRAGATAGVGPLDAAGVVPGGATALQAPAGGGDLLPVLDGAACTGCGDCWTGCPEGAIGATLLGAPPLLSAASKVAGTRGKEADALRRAHRHLAARVVSGAGSGEVTPDVLDAAWEWLAGQRKLSDDERPGWEAAFAATRDAVGLLAPLVPTALSGVREELLVWSVDPDVCTGCGICVAACAEEALATAPRTDDAAAAAAARGAAAAALPDTSGEALAAAAEHVGPAAAALLARSCASALLPSPGGPPGPGARLAVRLVSAAAELHGQRAVAARITALHDLKERIEARVRSVVGEAVAGADAAALADAVAGAGPARVPLGELVGRLEGLEVPVALDRTDLLTAARTVTAVADATARLEEGADGLGRARFAVLAVAGSPAADLLRYPLHPWFAPAAVVSRADAAATARALATSLAEDHLRLVQLCRRAKVMGKPGSDLERRLAAVRALTWDDLDAADRADAPRLLVFAPPGPAREALLDLLDDGLPLVVVAVDSGPGGAPPAALALDALVRGARSVLASSVGHADHLTSGLAALLAGGGPGLVHVIAPEPGEGEIEAAALLDEARATVERGGHVLLLASPDGALSLDGNPDPGAALAGPLVDRLRARFEADLRAASDAELAGRIAEHDAALLEARSAARAEHVQVLTDRLLELAGYAAPQGRG